MPTRAVIFMGRLFLDPASIGIGAAVMLLFWAMTSWRTGLWVGLGVHASLCLFSTSRTSIWEVDFTYRRGIRRLKKSLDSGLPPDDALAIYIEDLGRHSESVRDWLPLEVEGLRRNGTTGIDLLVGTVAVVTTKYLLEEEDIDSNKRSQEIQRIMRDCKPQWKKVLTGC